MVLSVSEVKAHLHVDHDEEDTYLEGLNALKDPKRITGKLHAAIKTGKVRRSRNGGQRVTIGVHRRDWNAGDDYYPAYTEYGHGGSAPAPAHPRPSDSKTCSSRKRQEAAPCALSIRSRAN